MEEGDRETLIKPSNTNRCSRVADFFKGMWFTRQTCDSNDRESMVKSTLKELVVYVMFLIILCILSLGATSPSLYYYTKVMSSMLLDEPYQDTKNTFRGSNQVMDFWRFVEGPLMTSLYWDVWKNEPRRSSDPRFANLLYDNRILGRVRLRQVRVRPNSCSVHKSVAQVTQGCMAAFSSDVESTDPFGPRLGTAWRYHDPDTLGSHVTWGKVASYTGGGFHVDLPADHAGALAVINSLRSDLWITRETRAIFIDFTVYNPNVNLFCIVRLLFELPESGGMVTSHQLRTLKLLRYVTSYDYFVLACEWLFVAFVLYYIIEEALEIRQLGLVYLQSVWNCLDLVVVTVASVCIVLSLYSSLTISAKVESLLQNADKYANFERLGFYQTQRNSLVALCVFFSWFKLFKYISFNRTMVQLSNTLSKCAKDVAGFCVMFIIVFFAFAQMGHLLFGSQVKGYSTMTWATFTLLRTILADFDFKEIQQANRVLGPAFFFVYVLFVFFVLMNMFLAIINESYTEVKIDVSKLSQFRLTEYLRGYAHQRNGQLSSEQSQQLSALRGSLSSADADTLSFDDIRTFLRQCNYSDLEIEMFFARYDVNGDRLLSRDQAERLFEHIDRHGASLYASDPSSEVSPPVEQYGASSAVNSQEIDEFSERIVQVESALASTIAKVQLALDQVSHMTQVKLQMESLITRLMQINSNPDNDDKQRRGLLRKTIQDEMADHSDPLFQVRSA